jgi:periplasmic protein TonB
MNMKAISKLAVLLSLGALAPFAASAKTLEQTYLDSYSKTSSGPVPIAVVSPQVSSYYAGDRVELEFTVDTKGKPSDFKVKSSPDSALSDAVLAAVKQWQFSPAMRNGAPEATKVVLPVVIVDEESMSSSYASN